MGRRSSRTRLQGEGKKPSPGRFPGGWEDCASEEAIHMAEEVRIGGGPGTAKIRHPVGVALLWLIPFYGLYWWYQVNREMVDLGKALNADGLGDNPTMSLLAFFPGFLL